MRLRRESRTPRAWEKASKPKRPWALPMPLLPTPAHNVRRVLDASKATTFTITGSPKNKVQVIVVDVDVYGTSLIRQLKTVFPNIKIIAISRSPVLLVQSIRAGATVALPKGLPPKKLARVVSSLAASKAGG